jgi:hypothetical protein
MQSEGAERAVWRVFRWRGTPHYPGSDGDALSPSAVLRWHRLLFVTVGAWQTFSTC